MTASRRDLRLMLGDAAVLTPNVAAELLPWDDHDAKAWLRAQGLVRVVDGRERAKRRPTAVDCPMPERRWSPDHVASASRS